MGIDALKKIRPQTNKTRKKIKELEKQLKQWREALARVDEDESHGNASENGTKKGKEKKECKDRSGKSKYGTNCKESKPYCEKTGMNWKHPSMTNAEACPVTCVTCAKECKDRAGESKHGTNCKESKPYCEKNRDELETSFDDKCRSMPSHMRYVRKGMQRSRW